MLKEMNSIKEPTVQERVERAINYQTNYKHETEIGFRFLKSLEKHLDAERLLKIKWTDELHKPVILYIIFKKELYMLEELMKFGQLN